MPFGLRIGFMFACVLFLNVCPIQAASGTTVTVMTQNMDAGTDLDFALAYLNTATPSVGIDLTYQEVLKNDFAGRAAILAKQIAAAKPDVVALQEVTLWSTIPGTVIADQLQLLLGALATTGEQYTVAAVNDLTNIALPMTSGVLLGFLDRDVVLVRNSVAYTNVEKHLYQASLPIPGTPFSLNQGWISMQATVGGKTFTFVDTHLLPVIPGIPDLQSLEVQELVATLGATTPIVVAGDFNSNATHTPPERTAAVATMLGAGFVDAWTVANRGNPGFTWPLYGEDPLTAHPQGPFERIDFVFERGFGVQSVDRIGWKGPHASDHAGVLAELTL